MQTTKANSQWGPFLEMWLCSRLSRGHGEPRQANLRPTRQSRWPGKSGSLPSILQRQRDVRGRWPFPANQREICGEERTPPSTFAQEDDEVSIFVLARGGMTLPVSFLAEDKDIETSLLLRTEKKNSKASSVTFIYHPLNFLSDGFGPDSSAEGSSCISHLSSSSFSSFFFLRS